MGKMLYFSRRINKIYKKKHMRVKAFIKFKGNFDLTYIGRISKGGKFHFRNNQLKKACLNKLKDTFHYDCFGGSLTIPDTNREMVKELFKISIKP
jgi:hypothetical protein